MASSAFWDFVIIVTLSYLTYDKVTHWGDYQDCYSPIQVFLLLTYGAFLVYLIVKRLKARPNLPCLIKKCADITLYWIMTPLVPYIMVQGVIWQVQNKTYTPSCLPESIDRSIIWLYITGLIVLELALILMAIAQLTAWWKRRRVRILMSEPNFSDLHQSLLNRSQESTNEAPNNEFGLEHWSYELFDVSPCDIVTICVLSYLISDEISDWSDYESCHSPIQVFLLLTYGSFIVYLIVMHLKAQPNLPWRIKKCVNITLYSIIHPLFLYIMVQGNIWQVQNDTYSRSCLPESKVPWICFWIAALFLWDVVLILRTIAKLTAWSRRRRVQALMNETNSSMNVDLNDVVGLELTDLERIPKERFLKSITNLFQQDSCSICYEDYQNDAIIVTLPGCEHVFHSHCINNWLLRNPLCPICRSNVRNNLVTLMNYKVVQTELTADVSL